MKAINTQEDLAMCQKIVIPEEDRYLHAKKKRLTVTSDQEDKKNM